MHIICMERKHITVTERHAEFIRDMNLQLSGTVRDKLDDMIDDLDWKSAEEMIAEEQEKA